MTGLDEISAELRTVDNYTRLLQTELRELNGSLTNSSQQALGLLQCEQLPTGTSSQRDCMAVSREVVHARLALDYLQVIAPAHCIGLPIHCNHQLAHYSGFWRISLSILNRFTPNLQA